MPRERWITKHYHNRGVGGLPAQGTREGYLASSGRLASFISSFFQRISEIDMQKFTVSEMISPGVTFGLGQIQRGQLSAQFEMRYRIGSHQQFIARDARQ